MPYLLMDDDTCRYVQKY
ncbi:hypothetical protein JMJ77_0010490 [Colletotrichum scovillei]|uniref:Uncharacterized protein n=1 Tax=Colletotrichum scovillei TaxID=1209932 RepID=A0A9P7QVU0_9PEZI|nr:hypothetical protein JMJ78_0011898 [Colletotrichum scovillei]KAG7042391.1 hypothetical protein JMJ77_0010490 [Colletotrichum scovillei]KAG7062425.1 hypothetical protein JMJ76_0006699 [Colletotrichum scovillei]